MKKPALATLITLLPLVAVCRDAPPTAVDRSPNASEAAALADRGGNDRDSDGSRGRSSRIEGDLSDRHGVEIGSFRGRVKLRNFVVENGRLVAVGEVDGVAFVKGKTARIDQRFSAPVKLPINTAAGPGYGTWQIVQVQGGCSVVHIEVGAINVSVLGAVGLTLQPIVLDVNLGTLLGSLLCGLLGLGAPVVV